MTGLKLTPAGAALAVAAGVLVVVGLAGGGWPYTLLAGLYALVLLAAARGTAAAAVASLPAVKVERLVDSARVVDGARVRVALAVRSTARRPLSLGVVDPPPPRVRREGPLYFEATLDPGGEAVFEYTVVAPPGRHSFPPVRLMVTDPLGLWVHEEEREAPLTLQAAPAVIDSALGARWERHGFGGAASRRLRGRGLEFYEIREYQPGDDPRRIAWAATARTGRLMVREDLVETPMSVVVFADLSAESWIGPPGESPADYIARAAVTIARRAAASGGRVGFTVFTGVSYVAYPLMRPSEALPLLVSTLSSIEPESAGGRAALAPALRRGLGVPGWGVRVLLLGPGSLREEGVEAIVRVRRRLGYPVVAALLLPPRRGALGELVWRVESARLEEARRSLARAGVGVVAVEARSVGVALSYVLREAARWAW